MSCLNITNIKDSEMDFTRFYIELAVRYIDFKFMVWYYIILNSKYFICFKGNKSKEIFVRV